MSSLKENVQCLDGSWKGQVAIANLARLTPSRGQRGAVPCWSASDPGDSALLGHQARRDLPATFTSASTTSFVRLQRFHLTLKTMLIRHMETRGHPSMIHPRRVPVSAAELYQLLQLRINLWSPRERKAIRPNSVDFFPCLPSLLWTAWGCDICQTCMMNTTAR